MDIEDVTAIIMHLMTIETMADFNAVCNDYEVGLEPEVSKGDCRPGVHIFAPTDLLKSVITAGIFMSERQDYPLSQKKLEGDDFDIMDGVPQVLRTMVNASHGPVLNSGSRFSVSSNEPPELINNCANTEKFFASTFMDMEALCADSPSTAQIFMHEGRPVLARKGEGVQLTLALEDVIINKIPCVAGSLVKIDVTGDSQSSGGTFVENIPEGVTVRDCREITDAVFCRLSAFAVDPDVRPEQFAPIISSRRCQDYTQRERAFSLETPIQELQAIAQTVTDAISVDARSKLV